MLAGAVAPERIAITIANPANADDPLDLSTVTAVDFRVRDLKRGERATWAATIASQSASQLVAEYEFEAADVAEAGPRSIVVLLTIPEGIRRAGPVALEVTS